YARNDKKQDARASCHSRIHFFIAKPKCELATSHTTFAIKSLFYAYKRKSAGKAGGLNKKFH
ncbi:MAG: hypothetical protein UHC59_04590, partial [Fibrobacteraceae bacterium]|nr:hypothetical protein [Fibrobacteraceae bacterium]